MIAMKPPHKFFERFLDNDLNDLSKLSLTKSIASDVVATGWGFQPDVSLGGILGCQEIFDRDGTVIFSVDSNQQSSVSNVWIVF